MRMWKIAVTAIMVAGMAAAAATALSEARSDGIAELRRQCNDAVTSIELQRENTRLKDALAAATTTKRATHTRKSHACQAKGASKSGWKWSVCPPVLPGEKKAVKRRGRGWSTTVVHNCDKAPGVKCSKDCVDSPPAAWSKAVCKDSPPKAWAHKRWTCAGALRGGHCARNRGKCDKTCGFCFNSCFDVLKRRKCSQHGGNCALSCGLCVALRPPIHKLWHAARKCGDRGSTLNVKDFKSCEEAAVAAGHRFLSYNSKRKECRHSATCDTFQRKADWDSYKEWLGAFNSTHANEDPVSDRAPVSSDAPNCKTQIAKKDRTGVWRNKLTCTSCHDGYALVFLSHKSRTGPCIPYDTEAKLQCSVLNGGITGSAAFVPKVCSKAVEARQIINPRGMSRGAVAHYRSVRGHVGAAVTRCAVFKEVVCDKDGHCDTHKSVNCLSVCKIDKAFKPVLKTCDATKCEGKYGASTCSNTAILE